MINTIMSLYTRAKAVAYYLQYMPRMIGITAIVAMFVLVALGPYGTTPNPKLVISPTTHQQTATTAPTTAKNGSAAGFDPSTFNVTPITNPDGSITFPTYTVPQSTTPAGVSGGTNTADVCNTARAAMDAVDAQYADTDAALRTEINNLQNQIITMTQYNPGTYGSGYTPPDTGPYLAKLQADNNTLMTNVRDANAKKAPYQQQWTANACV